MDFIGPFRTSNELGYILVIIDTFSKWIELYKCTHADAKEIAIALFENIGKFGAPFQIMADRGSQIMSSTK